MVRSILSNWAGLVVLGIISVVLTPILIHRLGNFYYGMWIMVGSAVDYYGLLEMGMRWTLFRFVAAYKGDRDRKVLNEILATAMAVVVAIGVLLAALTLLLMFILPKFFRLGGAEAHVFQELMLLLGLTVALAFPSQYLSAYLRGLQRFDLYNVGLVTVAVIRAILLVAVLRLRFGVIAVAIVTLTITVFSIPINWLLVRRADPLLSLSLRKASWHRTRELLSYSFYVFTTNVGEYLRFYTDSLVIARVLGVTLVTPFSIATRLMEYFRSIMSAVNGPLMVELSELGEGGDELRQLFLQGTKITALLSLLFGSVLLLNGKTLIRLWVGEGFVSVYSLMLVLTVGYVIAFAQNPCQLLIFARARQHRTLAWWTLAEGIANLLLSIYWAKSYGLLGVALGTAVPLMFVKLFVQPWFALRELRVSLSDYVFKAMARPIVVCSFFVLFCWLFRPSPATGGFLRFLFTLTWQAVLFGVLTYVVGLASDERQVIRLRGKKVASSLRLIRVAG